MSGFGFLDWLANLGEKNKYDYDRRQFKAKSSREERACYLAKRMADCPAYQKGRCDCARKN